jgi:hypothetical protein
MKFLRRLRHPRPELATRVVAGRSGWEIVRLREHFGHELMAHVYFHGGVNVLAAAATGTPGNLHAEFDAPIVEAEPVDEERLGEMALQALLAFRSEPVLSLADHKRTDWTTYKASGAKSVKAFEASSVTVQLRTEFTMIRLEAGVSSLGLGTFAVRGYAPLAVEHDELGRLLRKLVLGAHALRDAGVV